MPRLLRDWLVLLNTLDGNDTAGAEVTVAAAALAAPRRVGWSAHARRRKLIVVSNRGPSRTRATRTASGSPGAAAAGSSPRCAASSRITT
jgi:hypothetical protein